MHSLDCDQMNLLWSNDSIIMTFITFPLRGSGTEQLLSNKFLDQMHSLNCPKWPKWPNLQNVTESVSESVKTCLLERLYGSGVLQNHQKGGSGVLQIWKIWKSGVASVENWNIEYSRFTQKLKSGVLQIYQKMWIWSTPD